MKTANDTFDTFSYTETITFVVRLHFITALHKPLIL